MDRATLQQRLVAAERDLAIGAGHVARQRQIVADLERNGHDVTLAKEILAQFEETHVLRVAACNRLRRELTALDRQLSRDVLTSRIE